MVLTEIGLAKVFQRVKSFVASQLNSKASVIHTHTSSDITDLPSGYVVDSALSSSSENAVQNKVVKNALDGKSDTGHTHITSDITNFPTLSTVATSGDYDDLTNKPTIPTVNNATLKIQKNGTDVATFTANASSNVTANITVPTVNNATLTIQKNGSNVATFTSNASSNATANITVPTKVSQLTNDSKFITSAIKNGSIGGSGWCLLYGDLLIQWGTNVGTADFTINFYKAFSIEPIVVANYGDNVDFTTPCTADDVSKTAFIARHSSGGTWRVNWIAIGRA